MKQEITDIRGETRALECLSCAIAQNTVEIRGGSVIRSAFFDVHQDFEIPIPGFMILTSLRHLQSVSEFTDEESAEFMQVLRAIRDLQREVLGIDTVYLHQEEDTSHHFHLWLFPRHEWMNAMGRKAESMRPIMEYARKELKTEENLQKLDEDVRKLKEAASRLSFSKPNPA
jgi:diadenosine tetraphosphate (Ap4A) HIT family hydrolase